MEIGLPCNENAARSRCGWAASALVVLRYVRRLARMIEPLTLA